jgi:hypothetical protein
MPSLACHTGLQKLKTPIHPRSQATVVPLLPLSFASRHHTVKLPKGHAPIPIRYPLSFPPLAGSVLRLTFVSKPTSESGCAGSPLFLLLCSSSRPFEIMDAWIIFRRARIICLVSAQSHSCLQPNTVSTIAFLVFLCLTLATLFAVFLAHEWSHFSEYQSAPVLKRVCVFS